MFTWKVPLPAADVGEDDRLQPVTRIARNANVLIMTTFLTIVLLISFACVTESRNRRAGCNILIGSEKGSAEWNSVNYLHRLAQTVRTPTFKPRGVASMIERVRRLTLSGNYKIDLNRLPSTSFQQYDLA
jgi:hypothetical protein